MDDIRDTKSLKIARWRASSVENSLSKSMGIGGPGGTMHLKSSSSAERAMNLWLLMAAKSAVSSAAPRSAEESPGVRLVLGFV